MSTSPTPRDYKTTVNLTKTDFPQKANLREREPELLARWKASGLDTKILNHNKGKQSWILHDGPPYANGDIHLGHSLNKSLKDFVVRYRLMSGKYSPYVPGWDCHGLPIEQKVIDELGAAKARQKSPLEIRELCKTYALKYVNLQREQFKRLGIQGDWDNPYLTLSPRFEAGMLRAFRRMVERGLVYKGLRPVHWDWAFRTALAEAEIEHHENHESPSIYVRFPLRDCARVPALDGLPKPTLVIWTTTPWTLPANLAVSLHPEFDYVAWHRKGSGETLIVAKDLLNAFCQAVGLDVTEGHIHSTLRGADLEALVCAHPLLEKDSLVILGDHVTLDAGTGCVHTAPAHGAEDFAVGKRYNLPVFNPVDDAGCFTTDYPPMVGVNVFQANPKVIEELRARGLLVHASTIKHSYPYSWRSHKPLIVRATEQWFLQVERGELRQQALKAIDTQVEWIPKWGRDRIYNMVEARPDWCLSRQRSWGVPIPTLLDKKTGQSLLDLGVIDRAIEWTEKEGSDCWWRRPASDFLPEVLAGEPDRYEKEYNIFDVWFDSGASCVAVLEDREDLSAPADMYLEGSDQSRGWFQTSLLVSMAARERAPYNSVLTHGFILDEKGLAMSKSLGNVIPPKQIIDKFGADVLRLWVASEDYRGDVKVSTGILDQVATSYRKIRNTVRFLLSNLSDFDPAKDAVKHENLSMIERWALTRLAELVEECRRSYETYEFHRIVTALNAYCAVDLGALYLDMSKDILYCSGPTDADRRGAQTVLYEIVSALLRLMAPILVFTSDEAWAYLPGEKAESVHLADLPVVKPEWADAKLSAQFKALRTLREEVTRQTETLRQDKAHNVGASLDTRVDLVVPNDAARAVLEPLAGILPRFFIASQVAIGAGAAQGIVIDAGAGVHAGVHVSHARGSCCTRCWSWSEWLGTDTDHPELCQRCSDVVRRCHP